MSRSTPLVGASICTAIALVAYTLEKRRRKMHPVRPGYQANITVPTTKPTTQGDDDDEGFELYHNCLSTCSMKVRLCLEELGIPYVSHHVHLIATGRYENLRPWYLRVNPGGTVPTLVHNGHPVYESHEQLRYLAKYYVSKIKSGKMETKGNKTLSLIPDDPALQAEMELWIDRTSMVGNPMVDLDKTVGNTMPGQTMALWCAMTEKIPLWNFIEGFMFHVQPKKPMLFATCKLKGLSGLNGVSKMAIMVERSRISLLRQLDDLEKYLGKKKQRKGPWLLGEQYTLADVSWVPIFERLRQASSEDVFLNAKVRPHVAEYWERLQKRPSYEVAVVQHRKPIMEYGRKRLAEAKKSNSELRVLLEGK